MDEDGNIKASIYNKPMIKHKQVLLATKKKSNKKVP